MSSGGLLKQKQEYITNPVYCHLMYKPYTAFRRSYLFIYLFIYLLHVTKYQYGNRFYISPVSKRYACTRVIKKVSSDGILRQKQKYITDPVYCPLMYIPYTAFRHIYIFIYLLHVTKYQYGNRFYISPVSTRYACTRVIQKVSSDGLLRQKHEYITYPVYCHVMYIPCIAFRHSFHH